MDVNVARVQDALDVPDGYYKGKRVSMDVNVARIQNVR